MMSYLKRKKDTNLFSYWGFSRLFLPASCCLPALQRIREGSVADRVKVICVGDHIECINGRNIVGTRHYEVARLLKDLPRDKPFTLKLVEPMKAFGENDGRRLQHKKSFGT